MKWTIGFVALTLAGCGPGTSVEEVLNPFPPAGNSGPKPVEEVLETAVEATHVSTIALAALDGQGACASVVAGCTGPGCAFEVHVDVGTCPVPIADNGGSGLIVVTGTRTGPDSAMLVADFGQLALSDDSSWFVAQIGAMVATRNDDRVTVVYAQQSVTIRADTTASSTELSQHVWTADAALAGTPADTTDDVYTISGGVQDVEAGSSGAYVTQAALGAVQITPACRRNPSAGDAVVERVGAGSSIVLSTLHLGFHPECDGRADILSAFGTDMFSVGGSVQMDLLD